MKAMQQLNEFTLNIEFLLISIIQGVALAALGSEASKLLQNPTPNNLLTIIAGFLFILIFWSGAIIHALSFIEWPLDLTHNFLYFLVSLIEIITFSYMDDPIRWFSFVFAFFFSSGILYAVDLWLIKNHKSRFTSDDDKKLYTHILKQQYFELSVLIPGGLIFTAVSIWLLKQSPTYTSLLLLIQVFFALVFLFNAIHSFKKRSKLITQAQ